MEPKTNYPKYRDTAVKPQCYNGYHDAKAQSWKGLHFTEKETEGVTYQRTHSQLTVEHKFTKTFSVVLSTLC